MLEKIFALEARGASLKGEFIAALTTFATMSYVLAVHPTILAEAGMDKGALITVTALVAAVFSIIMGLASNLPIVMAPGMSSNSFFAFTIVIAMGVPWQAALGLVFYNGLVFLVLSLTGVRAMLLKAFPDDIKTALTVGIGLFIMFIGLKAAGIVVGAPPPGLVRIGDVTQPAILLSLFGLILMIVLQKLRIPGAILIAIVILAIIGALVPAPNGEGTITSAPERIIDSPTAMTSLWLALDLGYLWKYFGTTFPIVISLLFIDLFGSLVAMQAMCSRGGLVDHKGNMLKPTTALSVDALATVGGALMGTSTTNCYIESAAGIEAGGRTGLVGVFVGLFFLLALFLNPLIVVIPIQATAPALILIGLFMFQDVSRIDFSDLTVGGPAALSIILMPLSSISDGLALGMIAYVTVMLLSRRWREVSMLSYLLAGAFVLYYALGS